MKSSFRLGDLAAAAGGTVRGDASTAVERLVVDSRDVRPGDCFVALKGARRDGHEFAAEVLKRGATAVMVSRPPEGLPPEANCLVVPDTAAALAALGAESRRRFAGRVVGITGSNGKTTTKEMTARVLAAAGKSVLATRGNMNSQIGLPLMLMELEESHSHAVLEMGASEGGHIARLAELARPHVGVLTSIGEAHLEFFGSLQGVLKAKWELAESLPEDGWAVVNADDPLLAGRIGTLKCRVKTFGVDEGADVRAENVRPGPQASFDLAVAGERHSVRLPVAGVFNVRNALAAAAVAMIEGVPPGRAASALAEFSPPPLRMQARLRSDGAVFVLDAYNANPASMRASLESFCQSYPGRRLWAVLGSMLELGPAAEAEHAALGKFLAGLPVQGIFFVGAEGAWVEAGYAEAGGRATFIRSDDRERLRAELSRASGPEAAVLFKASRSVKLEEIFEPLLI
ncbi:MAG: UDP-N-acetylmuramoyl-tripeptide--D-alanyl-D-alanine ligase [Elusimicrobiota bacterium]